MDSNLSEIVQLWCLYPSTFSMQYSITRKKLNKVTVEGLSRVHGK